MMRTKYNPNLNSYAHVGNNNKYLQQVNTNKFRYIPDKDISKNETNAINSNPSNAYSNNVPATGPQQSTNYGYVANQQQPAFFPVFYSYYDYYSYVNALNNKNFPNYQNFQQIPYQTQLPNANIQYKGQMGPLMPQNLCYQQTGMQMPQVNSQNDFYNYCNPDQANIPHEDDSFGSIFYPSSLIHPTQYKKQLFIQTGKNDLVYPQNSQQTNEIISIQEEKKDDLENSNKIDSISLSTENGNVPNAQKQAQLQKTIEKDADEVADSQRIFKPKTFKEIEEEEKKSCMTKKISNTNDNNYYKSLKRSTKTW